MGGGIIPEDDMESLKKEGIDHLFGPGTDTAKIVEYIQAAVA